jgi:hypothetical protein
MDWSTDLFLFEYFLYGTIQAFFWGFRWHVICKGSEPLQETCHRNYHFIGLFVRYHCIPKVFSCYLFKIIFLVSNT